MVFRLGIHPGGRFPLRCSRFGHRRGYRPRRPFQDHRCPSAHCRPRTGSPVVPSGRCWECLPGRCRRCRFHPRCRTSHRRNRLPEGSSGRRSKDRILRHKRRHCIDPRKRSNPVGCHQCRFPFHNTGHGCTTTHHRRILRPLWPRSSRCRYGKDPWCRDRSPDTRYRRCIPSKAVHIPGWSRTPTTESRTGCIRGCRPDRRCGGSGTLPP